MPFHVNRLSRGTTSIVIRDVPYSSVWSFARHDAVSQQVAVLLLQAEEPEWAICDKCFLPDLFHALESMHRNAGLEGMCFLNSLIIYYSSSCSHHYH